MSVGKAILRSLGVLAMAWVAGIAGFLVWFGWKWGVHYAGVWWRGVRERLDAGDASINQASWFMRDRWEILGRVWDGPHVDRESAINMLLTAGVAGAVLAVLRAPNALLAGWLGRRAIRRDGIMCDRSVARRLGRRVYADGMMIWAVPTAIVWGAGVAIMNQLWMVGDYLPGRTAALLSMALPVAVVPLLDLPCALRWTRHLISREIRGRQRLCRWCGFDVTSLPTETCSECGKRNWRGGRDIGVRVTLRPVGARVAGAALAFAAVIACGIAWGVANAEDVSVRAEAGRVIDTLRMQRRETFLRVRLPVGRVMELRRGGERVLIRLEVPRKSENPPHPTHLAPFETGMRMLTSDAVGSPRRKRIEYPGADEVAPMISMGFGTFQVLLPPVRDRSGGVEYSYEIDGAVCWLQLPRDVSVARLVEVDGADAAMDWLLRDGPEAEAR